MKRMATKTEAIVTDIDPKILESFPDKFLIFVSNHNLKPPSVKTGNGMALSAMLNYPQFYFTRKTCDEFVNRFEIKTKDSIQLFNKHEQWGIQTAKERGKNYIPEPYLLSNKHKMRKNFKFEGNEEEKNQEIYKIKSTIYEDYIQQPNELWQLGHKNPNSTDNSATNLVLQPPIQGKYRDNFIFLDTLTKIPTPKHLIHLHKKGKSPYTNDQLKEIKEYLNSIDLETAS